MMRRSFDVEFSGHPKARTTFIANQVTSNYQYGVVLGSEAFSSIDEGGAH
jgi:hypothetical protein